MDKERFEKPEVEFISIGENDADKEATETKLKNKEQKGTQHCEPD